MASHSLPDLIRQVRREDPRQPKELQLSVQDKFQDVVLQVIAIASQFSRRWSLGSRLITAGFTLFLAFFASLSAFHASGESKSIPWTIGNGALAVVSFALAAWAVLRK